MGRLRPEAGALFLASLGAGFGVVGTLAVGLLALGVSGGLGGSWVPILLALVVCVGWVGSAVASLVALIDGTDHWWRARRRGARPDRTTVAGLALALAILAADLSVFVLPLVLSVG